MKKNSLKHLMDNFITSKLMKKYNKFIIIALSSITACPSFSLDDGDQFRLYNPSYDQYLFVSNDKSGDDNVVLAHPKVRKDEARNNFIAEPAGNDQFRLYNPSYDQYLFVSNDKSGDDNVVLAHPKVRKDEARNNFIFEKIS